MTLKFMVVRKINPRNPKAPATYHSMLILQDPVSNDELACKLVRNNEKFRYISGEILMMLRFVVPEALLEGKPVKIKDLGTFYPVVKTTGDENKRKVHAQNIKSLSVGFRPAGWMKNRLNEKKFEAERG